MRVKIVRLEQSSWIEEDRQPEDAGGTRSIFVDVFQLNRSVRDSHRVMILSAAIFGRRYE
jgi:hypothetical protein